MNVIKWTSVFIVLTLLSACKLGGTVTGLDERQLLTLRDDLSGGLSVVYGSGEFEFEADYSANTPFDVRILRQPYEQYCRISNHEGIANGADLLDIQVQCSDSPIACTREYAPVCGKTFSKPRECNDPPCRIGDLYQTYGNRCELNAAQADLTFVGECGKLDYFASNAFEPVRLLQALPEGFTPVAASFAINGDELQATPQAPRCGRVNYDVVALGNGTNRVTLTLLQADATPGERCQANTPPVLPFDLEPLKTIDNTAVVIEDVGTYASSSSADLLEAITKTDAAVQAIIADNVCAVDSECATIAYGSKACGGPATYLVYSTPSLVGVPQVELNRYVRQYNSLTAQYNLENDVISTCDVVLEPTIGCVNNQCVTLD